MAYFVLKWCQSWRRWSKVPWMVFISLDIEEVFLAYFVVFELVLRFTVKVAIFTIKGNSLQHICDSGLIVCWFMYNVIQVKHWSEKIYIMMIIQFNINHANVMEKKKIDVSNFILMTNSEKMLVLIVHDVHNMISKWIYL